jgi:hypothetical protein
MTLLYLFLFCVLYQLAMMKEWIKMLNFRFGAILVLGAIISAIFSIVFGINSITSSIVMGSIGIIIMIVTFRKNK